MWLLFIVILTATPDGTYPSYRVDSYHEYKECAPAADKLYQDLQALYPGNDYTVACVHSSHTTA